MSSLAEKHSYACEINYEPNSGPIRCFIATCPNFAYKDDLEIIKSEWQKVGIELSDEQADELWGLYSESICASWIGINTTGSHTWIRDATREFLNLVKKEEK